MLQIPTLPETEKPNLVLKGTVPTQSEVKKCLGLPLAGIFFQYSHPETKKVLGITTSLSKGPIISSYDQLISHKAQMRPPLNDDKIKACTHQGILNLGNQAFQKCQHQMELKKKEEFEQDLTEARFLFMAEKRRALELKEEQIRKEHEKCYEALNTQLKKELQDELKIAEGKFEQKLRDALAEERLNVTKEMLKIMQDEISIMVVSLHRNFQEIFLTERENLIKTFNQFLRVERAIADARLIESERKKNEDLLIQRHQLETQNFANVTYILCSERMRSSAEKHAIHQYFEKRIHVLQQLLIATIKSLKRNYESNEKRRIAYEDKLYRYEKQIYEIVRQFQKFINFTFDAVPGQAEFLLSLESLLDFKNDEEKSFPEKEEKFQIVEYIVDCENREWKPMQIILDKEEVLKGDNCLSSCNFEDMIYARLDNPDERKTMSQLLDENAHIVLKIEKTEISQDGETNKEENKKNPKELYSCMCSDNPDSYTVCEKNDNHISQETQQTRCRLIGEDISVSEKNPLDFIKRRIRSIMNIKC